MFFFRLIGFILTNWIVLQAFMFDLTFTLLAKYIIHAKGHRRKGKILLMITLALYKLDTVDILLETVFLFIIEFILFYQTNLPVDKLYILIYKA